MNPAARSFTLILACLFLVGGNSANVLAQEVAVEVQPQPAPSSEPPSVETGLVEAELRTGALLRLPFDQPFTLRFTLSGLSFGSEPPALHFEEYKRQLDSIPQGVCSSQRQGTFAGISPAPTANGDQQARFLMPALDPNRYLVLCLRAESRIEANLSPGEQEILKGELETALSAVAPELDQKEASELAARVRQGLERAVRAFASRQGLVGSIRLSDEWNTERVLAEFLTARQAQAQCDSESIAAQLSPVIENLPPSVAKNSLQNLVQATQEKELLTIEECEQTYARAMEQIEAASLPKPEEVTLKGSLESAIRKIEALDPTLSAFVAKTIELLQQRDSLILSSTLPASSAARRYVSADTGVAYVDALDRSVPYQGVNIYLRPVNPPSVTPLGTGRKGLARRTALTVGVTLTDDLVRDEDISGGTTVTITDDWTDYGSLLLGIGFRVNPALRIGGGAVLYRQLESLLNAELSTEISLYFSLSLDLDVRSLFTGGPAGLFNGGSPSPVTSEE